MMRATFDLRSPFLYCILRNNEVRLKIELDELINIVNSNGKASSTLGRKLILVDFYSNLMFNEKIKRVSLLSNSTK